jgi:hypothetical protein
MFSPGSRNPPEIKSNNVTPDRLEDGVCLLLASPCDRLA